MIFNGKKISMYRSSHKYRSPETGCHPTFYVDGQSDEYVNDWTHLGHIISADCDDKSDIISRCNTLCGQIMLLCYFGKCQSVVRQKFIFAYCYSLYGSILLIAYCLIQPLAAILNKPIIIIIIIIII